MARWRYLCGWQADGTWSRIHAELLARLDRAGRVDRSRAAVDSSSIEAPATSRPVRSATIVWKLISASSRPWLISGWYGV